MSKKKNKIINLQGEKEFKDLKESILNGTFHAELQVIKDHNSKNNEQENKYL